eukprot:GHVT01069602.1.p1 GENE.GHVT01069602.1~~GHVT01069602.1.p1  ORF type:complete len:367 (-),score=22.28 GHVT01069602.1:394-1494(-)
MGNANCTLCSTREGGPLDVQQEIVEATQDTGTENNSGNTENAKEATDLSPPTPVAAALQIPPPSPQYLKRWQPSHGANEAKDDGYFDRELAELSKMPDLNPHRTECRSLHTFTTGATYSGEWRGNKRDGYGRMTWPEGATYEGQWANTKANGCGQFSSEAGDVLTGEFKNNVAHGRGVLVDPDSGMTYAGQWYDDAQDGYGVETWVNGSWYEGEFMAGMKAGYGTYHWPDGSSVRGMWRDNHISGYAEFSSPDGTQYRGAWGNSVMHGYGQRLTASGQIFQGLHENDTKIGFGVLIYPDGHRYEGFWKDGLQHGKGRHFTESGLSKLGDWRHGRLTKWIHRPSGPRIASAVVDAEKLHLAAQGNKQ